MKRKRISKKSSKRLFRKTSTPRAMNARPVPMRGGFSL